MNILRVQLIEPVGSKIILLKKRTSKNLDYKKKNPKSKFTRTLNTRKHSTLEPDVSNVPSIIQFKNELESKINNANSEIKEMTKDTKFLNNVSNLNIKRY